MFWCHWDKHLEASNDTTGSNTLNYSKCFLTKPKKHKKERKGKNHDICIELALNSYTQTSCTTDSSTDTTAMEISCSNLSHESRVYWTVVSKRLACFHIS